MSQIRRKPVVMFHGGFSRKSGKLHGPCRRVAHSVYSISKLAGAKWQALHVSVPAFRAALP